MKIFFVILMIFSDLILIFSTNEELLKRKILILPFVNKNKIKEYDYLSDIIMETLRNELIETDSYEFTNFSLTDDKLKNKKYNQSDLLNVKTAKNIAIQFNADVVITGQYVIFDKKILIIVHTIDILTGELVALTKTEGKIGVELFDVIDFASKDITEKIIKALPMIRNNSYDEIINHPNKITFTPMKKTGIGLLSGGSCLILMGLPVLIYDLAGYSVILKNNKDKYLNTNEGYKEYDQSYGIFTGLLVSSICVTGIGVILAAIGLPLIIIKINKNDKITFNISVKNNFDYFTNEINFIIKLRL